MDVLTRWIGSPIALRQPETTEQLHNCISVVYSETFRTSNALEMIRDDKKPDSPRVFEDDIVLNSVFQEAWRAHFAFCKFCD